MKRPTRALLLAAGLGTRLRPITNDTPKCLVPIGGEPLLGHWLRRLDQAGCEAALVNTHYLSDKVEQYLQSWKSQNMAVATMNETELLGTAGTLKVNQEFFSDVTGLLIHADNFMSEDLHPFLIAHQNRDTKCLLTMLTFKTETPRSCGIVEVDDKMILKGFHEKVEKPPGNRANGALYAFEPSLIDHINDMPTPPKDFSLEVIPSLVGRIQTWNTDGLYLDIGTPESLATAQRLIHTKK